MFYFKERLNWLKLFPIKYVIIKQSENITNVAVFKELIKIV
jgi:hypothetical protein